MKPITATEVMEAINKQPVGKEWDKVMEQIKESMRNERPVEKEWDKILKHVEKSAGLVKLKRALKVGPAMADGLGDGSWRDWTDVQAEEVADVMDTLVRVTEHINTHMKGVEIEQHCNECANAYQNIEHIRNVVGWPSNPVILPRDDEMREVLLECLLDAVECLLKETDYMFDSEKETEW